MFPERPSRIKQPLVSLMKSSVTSSDSGSTKNNFSTVRGLWQTDHTVQDEEDGLCSSSSNGSSITCSSNGSSTEQCRLLPKKHHEERTSDADVVHRKDTRFSCISAQNVKSYKRLFTLFILVVFVVIGTTTIVSEIRSSTTKTTTGTKAMKRLFQFPTREEYEVANEYNDNESGTGSIFTLATAYAVHNAQVDAKKAIEYLSSSLSSTLDVQNDETSTPLLSLPEQQVPTNGVPLESLPLHQMPDSILRLGFDKSSASETNLYIDDDHLLSLYNTDDEISSSTTNIDSNNNNNNDIPLLGRSHKSGGLHDGCESTVMLVRHCEKGNVREHCDYNGFERSVYLASQFGNHRYNRWPLPSYLFATNPSGRDNKSKLNLREIELLAPLAKKANLQIDDTYKEGDESQLADDILKHMKTGAMCGKVTVISWKHSLIGHLAHKLGCGPVEGCPLDYKGRNFDDVWEISFVYRTPEDRKSVV